MSNGERRGRGRPEFDAHVRSYEAELGVGLAVTGEDRQYFARERIAWLAKCVASLGMRLGAVLDLGCGDGTTTPVLLQVLGAGSVLGVDVSPESVDEANRRFSSAVVRFCPLSEYVPAGECDLVYSSGTLHHILPRDRRGFAELAYRALRPGGLFAVWENNPYNPGTRYIMRRVAFDSDAIPIAAFRTRALARQAGFRILRTDYLFVFPHALRGLRALEPLVSRLPLGGQYQVLCRKP